jgi:hypothetical protein
VLRLETVRILAKVLQKKKTSKIILNTDKELKKNTRVNPKLAYILLLIYVTFSVILLCRLELSLNVSNQHKVSSGMTLFVLQLVFCLYGNHVQSQVLVITLTDMALNVCCN